LPFSQKKSENSRKAFAGESALPPSGKKRIAMGRGGKEKKDFVPREAHSVRRGRRCPTERPKKGREKKNPQKARHGSNKKQALAIRGKGGKRTSIVAEGKKGGADTPGRPQKPPVHL